MGFAPVKPQKNHIPTTLTNLRRNANARAQLGRQRQGDHPPPRRSLSCPRPPILLCHEHGQHQEDNGSQNMIIHGDNLEPSKPSCRAMKEESTVPTSILPITQVTKAGSTTTPSTTRELRNGLVKSLARKAKTSRATTNGYA